MMRIMKLIRFCCLFQVTVGWLNVYVGELVVPATGDTPKFNDAIIWQIIVGVIGGILLIVVIVIVIRYLLRKTLFIHFVRNNLMHGESLHAILNANIHFLHEYHTNNFSVIMNPSVDLF